MTLEQAFAQLPSIQERFDRMFTKDQEEALTTLVKFMVNSSVGALVAADVATRNSRTCIDIALMYKTYVEQGVSIPVAVRMIRDYQYIVFTQRKE